MHLRVSATDEHLLLQLQTQQNFHAYSLGILVLSYLQKRNEYLAEEPVNNEKLGALEFERHKQEVFWLSKVSKIEAFQRKAGEAALRHVGINYDKGDYSIVSGVVMELRTGEYVPVERVA